VITQTVFPAWEAKSLYRQASGRGQVHTPTYHTYAGDTQIRVYMGDTSKDRKGTHMNEVCPIHKLRVHVLHPGVSILIYVIVCGCFSVRVCVCD
jgi:hypothetical protein